MLHDIENTHYQKDALQLYSNTEKGFQKEKFSPKLEFISSYFSNQLKNKKILDVGIGYGLFLYYCENVLSCQNTYGMDPFPRSIEIAKKHIQADLRCGNIEQKEWPFKKFSFDVITCFDVVEHLEDPSVFFKKVKNYIKEDGIIIVTTPNKDLPYLMRKIPFIGIADENPTHINVHNHKFWKRLCMEYDFNILKTWKGEHLTHIKYVTKLMSFLTKKMGLDHRNVPFLNHFEQSFCMIFRK